MSERMSVENVVRNVFCGMGVTAAVIALAVIVAMLVYTFIDDCIKLGNGEAEVFSIVALVLMLVGGAFCGLMAYIG